jgi:hypothetical protein
MKKSAIEKKHDIIIERSDRSDSKYIYYAVGDMRAIRLADTLSEIDDDMTMRDREYEMYLGLA